MVLLAMMPPVVVLSFGGYAILESSYKRRVQDAAIVAASKFDREVHAIEAAGSILARLIAPAASGDPNDRLVVAQAVAASTHGELVLWRQSGTTLNVLASVGRAGPIAGRELEQARLVAASGHSAALHLDDGSVALFVPIGHDAPSAGPASSTVVEVPVVGSDGTLLLDLHVPLETRGATIVIESKTGEVFAAPKSFAAANQQRLLDLVHRVVAIETAGVETLAAPENSLVGFAAPTLAPDLRIVVIQAVSHARIATRSHVVFVIAITVLSIVVAAAAVVMVGGWLVLPLKRLSESARAVAAGLEVRQSYRRSSVAEIEELSVSVARADEMSRRRAAAERLALNEARTGQDLLASVINGTADLIDVKNLKLEMVLLNRAALLFGSGGRSEWQVLGRRADTFLPADEARTSDRIDREVIATGQLQTLRVERERSNGTLITYAATKTAWRDGNGTIAGVVTVMHDFSAQRAAEERLASVQAELLRATRLSTMGAMASGLAHELNQPLSAATNFLSASARLLARDPPDPFLLTQARGAVAEAREQTLRAGNIVRRLRDFVGRGETELRVENIAGLVHEIGRVACAGGEIDPKQIVIRGGDPSVAALVDGTQLQQVLLNLIKNASEAIAERPNGAIELAWQPTDDGIEITVADNGPGLSPDVRDRLFIPFVSTKALGMGIGLAICRTIVEGHGGTLDAEDNPGGGALFRIVLPPLSHHADDHSEGQRCT